MSFQARRKLLEQVSPWYRETGRKEKSVVIEEFIVPTGHTGSMPFGLLQ